MSTPVLRIVGGTDMGDEPATPKTQRIAVPGETLKPRDDEPETLTQPVERDDDCA